MSRIQPRQYTAELGASVRQPAAKEMPRKEKTSSFLTEILPMALDLGLKLGETGGKKTPGAVIHTNSPAGGKAAGAAGAAPWPASVLWLAGLVSPADYSGRPISP